MPTTNSTVSLVAPTETPSEFSNDDFKSHLSETSHIPSQFPSNMPSTPPVPVLTPMTNTTVSRSNPSKDNDKEGNIGDIPVIENSSDVLDVNKSNSGAESIGLASAGILILRLLGFTMYKRKHSMDDQNDEDLSAV